MERFEAPEVLFNPSLIDCEKPGIHEMLFNMIQEADIDLRPAFYKQIVLSGGSTMYPGNQRRYREALLPCMHRCIRMHLLCAHRCTLFTLARAIMNS